MAKCVCCKFDNCKAEFDRHRSNTSFFALDTQFCIVAELMENPGFFTNRVCGPHKQAMKAWLDGVFSLYDSLKPGVRLVKIR